MQDIPVLLFVVACSANLLDCKEVTAGHEVFLDMAACTAARADLPPRSRDGGVVMAKCRYALPAGHRPRGPDPDVATN